MDDIDIYHSAKFYINQYGVDASVHVAKQAVVMLARDDLEGFNTWMQTGRAIEEMQATTGRSTY